MEITPETKDSSSEQTSEQPLFQTVSVLNQINDRLNKLIKINERILEINETILQRMPTGLQGKKGKIEIQPDSMALLSLPAALRKTALVLYKLEQATADDLAKETNRMRAVESAAANELARLGFFKKKRVGHEVYFYIEASKEE